MFDMKNKLERTPQGLFNVLRRHPYLFTILICGLLVPFGYADRDQLTTGSFIYLGIVLGASVLLAIWLFNIGKTVTLNLLLSGTAAAGAAFVMLVIGTVENKVLAIALTAVIVAACVIAALRLTDRLDDASVIAVLILLGIAIRFVYVLYTSYKDRQHDVGYWNFTWGHANYIEYWYNNGLKLPDFDVRTIWQYYHPPFHHWLMAGLLKLLTALGVPYLTAAEGLQMLPMLYSSLTLIVSYRIFRMISLKGAPLIMAMAVLCCHPTFIIFGGSFNNDMLLMLLMTSSVMWALRWYREPKLRNIIPLALCVGLGMMTKLSGWVVAPAIAFLFLLVLIKNIRKPMRYIGQYALFGVVSVPLGLWWQARNLLLFNVPLTYVPEISQSSSQYIGNISTAERLFSFVGDQLSHVYFAFVAYGAPYNEYNPTLGLFKSAIFDEGQNSITAEHFPQITVTAPVLFWLSVVLFIVAFVCFVVMMIKKSKVISGVERVFFSLLFAVNAVSYYLFCFAYPQTCTMNIRYAMPLITLCVTGLALFIQSRGDSKPARWFRRIMYGISGAFCAMSCLMFIQLS